MHFAQDQFNWDQEYGRNKETAAYNSNHYKQVLPYINILGGGKVVEQAYNLVAHVKTYPQLGLAILTVPGCKALRYTPVHSIVGGKKCHARFVTLS